MLIPELGTHIILLEDFTFTNDNNEVIFNKGMVLSIMKFDIKNGRSNKNNVVIRVLKLVANKNSIFYNQRVKIPLCEFNEMEFEFKDYNKDTKEHMGIILDSVKEFYPYESDQYREVEKALLNGKNMGNFQPHQMIGVFLKSCYERLERDKSYLNRRFDYPMISGMIMTYLRKMRIGKLLNIDEK